MPIGGFVINVRPEKIEEMVFVLVQLPGVEVHGHDDQGSVVAVIEAASTRLMEKVVEKIREFEMVLSIGLTYLNMEDEVCGPAAGAPVSGPMPGRQPGLC